VSAFGAGLATGGADLHRVQRIDRGGQNSCRPDEIAGSLGDRGLVGGHGRHRLAHEHDAIDGEHGVGAGWRLLLEPRNVCRDDDRPHAGQRLRLGRVDALDPRVRVRAAQQLGVQHPLGLEVGHVLGLAGDLLGAVRAGDRQADALHLARGLHHCGHRSRPPSGRGL
jgi:hypothetical protein